MWGFGKKKLITHDGAFHADDVFACATLVLILEKKEEQFEIIRTRDEEKIKAGDYVFDVGGIYDADQNRFDHHQVGGAGVRADGSAYSSFGLVWRKFGKELCSSDKVWITIDKKLVAPIDVHDNGQKIFSTDGNISPYLIQNVFFVMERTWKESPDKNYTYFLEAVAIAKRILKGEIAHAEAAVEAEQFVLVAYQNAQDKRIIVLDKDYPFENILQNFSEPLYVVRQRQADGLWKVQAVRDGANTFKNRKDFPVAWGGLRNGELAKISGVADAVFCHRGLFLAVAKSRKGALSLAEKALTS